MNPYHTSIRTFDGKIVFVPNTQVLSSRIVNYHLTPTRRIELMLRIETDGDLIAAKLLLLESMQADERVLTEPEPVAVVMNADAEAAAMTGYCFVNNDDWRDVQSDLWLGVVEAVQGMDKVSMALPSRKIYLQGEGLGR